MSRLEDHAMLRGAATDIFKFTVCSARELWLGRNRGGFFCGMLIFWDNCSHEGQILLSGSSFLFLFNT